MNKKIITKLLASMLAFTLTFANVVLLGVYTRETLAASVNLEDQNTAVNSAVEFDAYFEEEGETSHYKEIDVSANQDKMYLKVKVTDGYLIDTTIKLEDSNFKFVKIEDKSDAIQEIADEEIKLNRINKGESVVLELPIEIKPDSNFAIKNLDKITKVNLEGTFVNVQDTFLSITANAKAMKVSKAIDVNVKMIANAKANLEEDITKYVQFDTNGKKGVVLQASIKSNLDNSVVPVKTTELQIEIPKINNIEPNAVVLSAVSTKATNGLAGKIYTSDDYETENGIITLKIQNLEKDDGTISWMRDEQDEIILTCIYGEDAIVNETEITLNANSVLTTYTSVDEVNGSAKNTIVLSEKVGEIVSFDLSSNVEKLAKGYMMVPGAKGTEYTETVVANIGYSELVDSLKLESTEKYLDKNKNEFESNPLYKYTKVSEENFVNMFGEEGYINILNNDGEIISTLNKENLEYKYEKEVTYIRLETSKPKVEGILEIENGREVKSAEYDKAQIELFNKFETKLSSAINYQGQDILKAEVLSDIDLEEPKTVANVNTDAISLSTVEKNEAVELRIELDTNDASKSLYKNPKITLEFPTYIKDLDEGKIALLYDKELKLGKSTSYKNNKGNIVVEVPLEGEQTTFNMSSVSNGATILVYATLEVDELTPNMEDSIKVYFSNENKTEYESEENGIGVKNIPIIYAAQKGIITKSTITGYKGDESTVSAFDKENTATIESSASEKTAVVKLDMVNSTGKEIADVKVLGRIPFAGNKSAISNESLGSTFTASMTKKLSTSNNNVEIYYSNNESANTSIEDEQNGWTKDVKNLNEVKSYLITLNNDEMETGERMSFEYDIEIPENVGYDAATYSTFGVYYSEVENDGNDESETSVVKRAIQANTLGLKTVKAFGTSSNTVEVSEPVLVDNSYKIQENDIDVIVTRKASGNVITDETKVKEGQYIDYEVKMVNMKDKDLAFDLEISKNNAKFYGLYAYDYQPDNNEPIYAYAELQDEKLTEEIAIKAGSTKTYKYTLVVDANSKGEDLESKVLLKQNGENIKQEITKTNQIEKGLVKLNITYNRPEGAPTYSNSSVSFDVNITNITDSNLTNITVEIDLPSFLTYVKEADFEDGSDFDEINVNGNKLSYKINSLNAGENAEIYLLTKSGKLDISDSSRDVSIMAKANVNGENYSSNIYTRTIEQGETKIKATMTGSVLDEYISDGEEIIYTIEVENLGVVDENIRIQDTLPDGIKVQEVTLVDYEGNENKNNNKYQTIDEEIVLPAKSVVSMKIKTKVDASTAKASSFENTAIISGNSISETKTNTVIYKIKNFGFLAPDPTPTGVNPTGVPTSNPTSNPTQNPTNVPTSSPTGDRANSFSISGIIWNDLNSDGKRNESEQGIANITVMLMNNKKSEFVKDASGRTITTKTAGDGTYKFDGLVSGEYVAVFMYDTELYKVTPYQKEGVSSTQNSDAIDGTIKMNGVNTNVAVTDIITVGQANVENIDLGLTISKVFDLKLDKKISTIIVQNGQGTNTYTYDNKNAKVEIPSKYMKGSTLTIEYKISVTNEGDVPGKAGKVVDYIPSDLEFSSDINNEWYKGTDRYIYTTEFENTLISPGETREVTLVLTKTLKEEVSEITSNSAEIVESYNTLGLKDIDSTAGNKAEKEDDLGTANLIVTIKTGVMTYTLIAIAGLLIIAIFAGGILIIKKKVLTVRI